MASAVAIRPDDDRFRHSSNIKGIASTVREAVVLVLLRRGTLMYAIEMASSGIICIPGVMKFGTVVQAILRLYLRNWRRRNVGVTDGRGL
jgi:hypothetical protein